MDISTIGPIIGKLPIGKQEEILELLEELEHSKDREQANADFLSYVKLVWPAFIEGQHHRVVGEAFNRIAEGKLKRLIINMAPRHTKSEFASHLLPSWFLGKYPTKKVIQASNKGELAVGFGRKVRNMVASADYGHLFPGVSLSADSKAAGRWNTNHGGDYFAVGVGGMVTGRGADLLIIDDPHSEQEAAMNSTQVYDSVYEWYTSGPRQRLQPKGAICIVMTRWHKRDLTGQILKASIERGGADDWEIIELPAILDEHTEIERPIWPGFWDMNELKAVRSEIHVSKWNAQYQQDPTSEEGALVKREWWQEWTYKSPPECEFIIQSWDTAFLAKETADFSACTTWGVWRDDNGVAQIILLDALQERLEFPELKKRAYEMYRKREPDAFIVEAKAAGTPLVQELRRMGIPVQEYKPNRGNDKIARVNSVADLFSSGFVWAPKTRWAEMVQEDFASFPYGEHDDLVDSGTQALLRFRQGGFISLDSDDMGETENRRRVASYY